MWNVVETIINAFVSDYQLILIYCPSINVRFQKFYIQEIFKEEYKNLVLFFNIAYLVT